MKKITSSAVLSFVVLGALGLFAPAVQSQMSAPQIAQPSQLSPVQPNMPTLLNDPAGEDCKVYTLDVPSLVDATHKMYWKQHDCIRVYVTNNPFLFSYVLTFPENVIKEDDPLGAFAGKFGLDVSSVGNTGGKHQDATPTGGAAGGATRTSNVESANAQAQSKIAALTAAPATKTTLSEKFDDLARMELAAPSAPFTPDSYSYTLTEQVIPEQAAKVKAQINGIKDPKLKQQQKTDLSVAVDNLVDAKKLPPPPPPQWKIEGWKSGVKNVTDEAAAVEIALNNKTEEFGEFGRTLPGKLKALADQGAAIVTITKLANDLYAEAEKVSSSFPKGSPNFPGYPHSTLERQLVILANDAAPLHQELVDAQPTPDDNSAGAQTIRSLMAELHKDGETAAYSACTDRAMRDTDFTSLRDRIMVPLRDVLTDGLSFGYVVAARQRVGPYSDPTAVTMTLTRQPTKPFTTSPDDPKTPKNTMMAYNCSSDASDLFEHGADYKTFEDFFSDKPLSPKDNPSSKPNTYTKNLNKPTAKDQTPATSTATTKDTTKPGATDNTVLVQPWFFGKARLVITGGLTTGFLGKQEFQRSSAISGSTSSTVIGLKTDTRYRLSPMLYAHTLLYSRRHDSDAFYATLGVTANSDTKGTDPEFLLGLSRSLAQQRFFVTLGAYIGEKQKLDGGLQVGQTIPATLTGELPVTKSYHAAWGFGISYRLGGTKDPQKAATTPSTKPSGSKTGSNN